MSPPDGVTGDTRYFKTDEIENKIVSFLDNTQTIWLSPVRNKENEFHRQDPYVIIVDLLTYLLILKYFSFLSLSQFSICGAEYSIKDFFSYAQCEKAKNLLSLIETIFRQIN